jgi:tubby-related protein 1
MTGQKNQIMRSAYYLITLDQNSKTRKTPGYLGKLRSNLLCTEFTLYGEGENPKTKLPLDKIRNEHAAVVYKTSIFSEDPAAQMNVIIPQVVDERNYCIWKPLHVHMNLLIIGKRLHDTKVQ